MTKIPEQFAWAAASIRLSPSHRVLELGCGAGLLVAKMLVAKMLVAGMFVAGMLPYLKTGTLTAIDQSAPMIAKAKKRNANAVEDGRDVFTRSHWLILPPGKNSTRQMRCLSELHYQKTKIMELQKYLEILDANTAETLEIVSCETGVPLHASRSGSWNLLQILEHLVLTDRYVYELLRKPSWYFATVTELYGEHKLRRILVEKHELCKAPPALEPSSIPAPLESLMMEFTKTRMALKHDLQTVRIAIDKRYYINPFLGEMTVADWLWFIPVHAERHHLQLQKMYAELNRRAC